MTARPAPFAMTGFDLLLYAGLIWAWSTSWLAITYQLGAVSPEVSVFWRFLLTVPVMALLGWWRGETLRFDWATHRLLLLTGVAMFSTNFILFYYTGTYLPSGLLAVIFSLASIINFGFGVTFGGEPFRWRLAAGAVLGVIGVAALFQPQLANAGSAPGAITGLMLGMTATLCFSSGSQVSARLQRRGIPVIAATTWGMIYGTLWAGLIALGRGQSFAIPLTAPYLGAMAFLIFSATVLAFYTYLTLVGRIGAARASYATVIFPIFALALSSLVEGYRWTPLALAGVVMAVAGNLLVLRRDRA